MPDLLHYLQPAQSWTEALPLGNGQLGAMVHGRICREIIQFNHEKLWEGGPCDRRNPRASGELEHLRALAFGDGEGLEELADAALIAIPRTVDPFQSLGELLIELDDGLSLPQREINRTNQPPQRRLGELTAPHYRRELDLAAGETREDFVYRDLTHRRFAFVSLADNLLCWHWEADGPGLSALFSLHRQRDVLHCAADAAGITLEGRLRRGGTRFAIRLDLRHQGGELLVEDGALRLRDARSVELRMAAEVLWPDEKGEPLSQCQARLAAAAGHNVTELRQRQQAAHGVLYGRAALELAGGAAELPTDQRLERLRQGHEDPDLEALHVAYGRYLLIASSAPGSTLPANLQGLWCHELEPAWQSDFHININLQMNYWPAEPWGLGDCHAVLLRWLRRLASEGETVAQVLYGCRGWCAHHVSNPWGNAWPMDGACGIWPMGGVWLCAHLWQHWRCSGDRAFLRDEAWPLLRGAARFVLDFLVEAPAGSACPGALVTCPSYSPENAFIDHAGRKRLFTYAATMDLQLIRELFANCRAAASELGIASDDEVLSNLASAEVRLPPLRISTRNGGIQEWVEDYEEAEPGHRHISHLYALYPHNAISPQTPELFAAAQASLDRRLAHGGGHTGWSKAWLVAMYARLHNGDAARGHWLDLLRHKTHPNLFDVHPPFQIDGNFGITAAAAELLAQRHGDEILLLPALPTAWSCGAVRGLCLPGGLVLDLRWQDGHLSEAALFAARDTGPLRLRPGPGEPTQELAMAAGETLHWRSTNTEDSQTIIAE